MLHIRSLPLFFFDPPLTPQTSRSPFPPRPPPSLPVVPPAPRARTASPSSKPWASPASRPSRPLPPRCLLLFFTSPLLHLVFLFFSFLCACFGFFFLYRTLLVFLSRFLSHFSLWFSHQDNNVERAADWIFSHIDELVCPFSFSLLFLTSPSLTPPRSPPPPFPPPVFIRP